MTLQNIVHSLILTSSAHFKVGLIVWNFTYLPYNKFCSLSIPNTNWHIENYFWYFTDMFADLYLISNVKICTFHNLQLPTLMTLLQLQYRQNDNKTLPLRRLWWLWTYIYTTSETTNFSSKLRNSITQLMLSHRKYFSFFLSSHRSQEFLVLVMIM